jgi:hypothetical protein
MMERWGKAEICQNVFTFSVLRAGFAHNPRGKKQACIEDIKVLPTSFLFGSTP